MSATGTACEIELLSAYLDDELGGEEMVRLEAHLETCHSCQSRLAGLTRVSETLRSLERAAPPPILEELVLGRREVPGARSWSGRLAQMNEASRRTRSTIGLVFAMVLMLVIFVYLFSLAQSRHAPTSTVISVSSQQLRGAKATEQELVRVADGDFADPTVLREWAKEVGAAEVWRQRSVSVVALEGLSSVTCSAQAPNSPVAVLHDEGGVLHCSLRPALHEP